ncbi:MAG: hypothetical protein JRN06_06605 [Nitrososphaerota archaeon]|nr:hypothetical protein [Nitrososphaerota archaeon]
MGKVLEREFHVPFRETALNLPHGARHSFDLVSKNQRIVAEVKTSEPNKAPGRERYLRSAQLGDFARDILLLLAVRKAKKRLLILTNKTVYDLFLATPYARAAIAQGIEVRYVKVRESARGHPRVRIPAAGSQYVIVDEAFGPPIPVPPVPGPVIPVNPVQPEEDEKEAEKKKGHGEESSQG